MAFLLEPAAHAANDAYASPGREGVVVPRPVRALEDRCMWKSIVAVCFGASVGALLRWWLSAQLNDTFPPRPLGTLAANLSGGYIVGLAIAAFAAQPALAPEWRLLVITGLCGGLTTFSTFSAEIVGHLAEGRAFCFQEA